MENPEWQDFQPRYSGLFALVNLGWIIVSIFRKLDPNRYIFLALLFTGSLMTGYYLIDSRRNKQPLQQTAGVFYLLCWLGIATFTDLSQYVDLQDIGLGFLDITLRQIMFLGLLPVAIIWMQPRSSDYFFGLLEATDEEKTKSLWKISAIIILILNIIEIWIIAELLILIPLIYEHVSLFRMSKNSLPVLTLHIQRELLHKFAVPISMMKAIALIMTAFIFEMLDSRLWILAILGYIFFGMIWFIDFIIPEEARNPSKKTDDDSSIEDIIELRKSDSTIHEDIKVKSSQSSRQHRTQEDENIIDSNSSELVPVDANIENLQILSTGSTELTEKEKQVGQRAHALGKRVRTELQKPQYNLNHIMSTLSKEDFTTAYRVDKEGYRFDSTQGMWEPPKDLILFPIQLEDYDYRRADEILLLGFNRPLEKGFRNVKATWGENNEHHLKMSGNQIQIGDTTFHMKTLVLTKHQWEEVKDQLEYIDDVTDISYTGFTTLHQMQEKLAEISDKWTQLRKQAEIAVVNFMAGMLGTTEPVFMGKNMLKEPENTYLIEDVEENKEVS